MERMKPAVESPVSRIAEFPGPQGLSATGSIFYSGGLSNAPTFIEIQSKDDWE
jgi:hypothetical protein